MSDERLHEYFDGQLPPEEKARFEHALDSDPDLALRLRELRELDTALGTLPGHAAPPGFTVRVAQAARRRRHPILRFAAPLAAAAAVILAALLTWPSSGDGDGPADEAAAYIWESDNETYGSLALFDLEDQILLEMEGT